MSLIKGYVEKVWTNDFAGKPTTYSIVIDNVKYSTYTNRPSCAEGDYVSFDAKQNGNFWNCNVKTLKKETPPSGEAAPAPTPTGNGAPVPYSGGKSSAVQDAINYQAARNSSIAFVGLLHTVGVLDLGTSKKGDKIANVEVYVDKYTMRFLEDTRNLGHKSTTDAPDTDAEFADDDLPF